MKAYEMFNALGYKLRDNDVIIKYNRHHKRGDDDEIWITRTGKVCKFGSCTVFDREEIEAVYAKLLELPRVEE